MAEEEMKINEVDDFFDLHYFALNKKFQIITGLWPLETGYLKYLKQGAMASVIIWNLILFSHALGTFCGTNMDYCCENMIAFVYSTSAIFKLIGISTTGAKFTVIYRMIARNWRNTTDKVERSILEKYALISKRLSLIYIIAFSCIATIVTQLPFIPLLLNVIMPLNESREAIIVINTDYSITPYTKSGHLWVHYSLTGTTTAAVFIATDATFLLVVFQILAIFEVVKQRIRQAVLVAQESSEQKSYGILIKAVQLHKDAIQFLQLTDEANSLQFFAGLGGTIFMISFGSIALLIRMDAYADLFRVVILTMGYLFQLFILCLLGELVINASTELFNFPMLTDWHVLPIKSKKLILFFMGRTIRPSYYTAGGLYIMNVQNFASLP
ncbi:uncharacterized protein LOC106651535 isoform X2 [Trichogramma pretiosum]|uniref:uncharacterized protein LOC106651535 isoform X2 n=1 Tax=Trichogramma pretiosum TaxID=7493 RepID=UPI0006C95BE1|nr:uncharacterized protein LOC106651535 isoform X2 [Trichogramma pretiosum]